MARWKRRVDKVLMKEKERNKSVYGLYGKLQRKIHGFSPVDTNLLEEKIRDVCHNFELRGSKIKKIELEHIIRNKIADEMPTLTVEIEGSFNGVFKIKASRGWQAIGKGERKEIYYVSSSDCTIKADVETRIDNFYRNYEQILVDEIVDMAFDEKHYVAYDGRFKRYEIWNKYPDACSDTISGYLDDRGNCVNGLLQNIKKLRKCNNIKEFSKENLYGEEESYTQTWVEYSL